MGIKNLILLILLSVLPCYAQTVDKAECEEGDLVCEKLKKDKEKIKKEQAKAIKTEEEKKKRNEAVKAAQEKLKNISAEKATIETEIKKIDEDLDLPAKDKEKALNKLKKAHKDLEAQEHTMELELSKLYAISPSADDNEDTIEEEKKKAEEFKKKAADAKKKSEDLLKQADEAKAKGDTDTEALKRKDAAKFYKETTDNTREYLKSIGVQRALIQSQIDKIKAQLKNVDPKSAAPEKEEDKKLKEEQARLENELKLLKSDEHKVELELSALYAKHDEFKANLDETDEDKKNRIENARKLQALTVGCRDSKHIVAGSLPCNDVEAVKKDTNDLGSKDKPVSDISFETADTLDCEKPEYIEIVNRQKGAYVNKFRPGFKSVVKCLARDDLRREAELYYKGEAVDWFTSERLSQDQAIPVCNVGLDQKMGDDYGAEIETNHKGETCESMCKIKVKIFKLKVEVEPPGECKREAAWYRGSWIHALNYQKENLFKELESGSIKITAMDEAKPCAQLASDLLEISQKNDAILKQATKFMAKKFKPKKDASFEELEKLASQEECTKIDRYKQLGSFSVCTLDTVQKQLLALWSYFLNCEVHVRAFVSINKEMNDPKGGLGNVQKQIQGKCRGKICGNPLKCKDSKASQQATACYQDEIRKLLPEYLRKVYPTTGPMEMPNPNMPATAPTPGKLNPGDSSTDKCA